MEEGYHIAITNNVAMLNFASKENVLMKPLSSTDFDFSMKGSASVSDDATSQYWSGFRNAQRLSNSTAKIVLQRIGDPNLLPFIHIIAVFMLNMY